MSSIDSQSDGMEQAPNNAVVLGEADNVVVACRLIRVGEQVRFNGRTLVALSENYTGHKIACVDMAEGQSITKYGAPIRSATQVISVGEHVHLHNMKSDYIATFTRKSGSSA